MPVYRDKDGNIIEEPSHFEPRKRTKKEKAESGRKDEVDDRFVAPTVPAGKRKGSPGGPDEGEDTEDASAAAAQERKKAGGATAGDSDSQGDRPKTRLLRRSGKGAQSGQDDGEAKSGDSKEESAEEDVSRLVTGWIVIVEGPGAGTSLKLGYGSNTIGRGESNRVSVDFGDSSISRENHAVLTYDGRGRKFYIQHGGGVNLTYLGEDPVLSPAELKPMHRFTLGDTEFVFVPFCGPDFDWADSEVAR
jgi:hypothetical protein